MIRGALTAMVVAVVLAAPAAGGGWLPHPSDATWPGYPIGSGTRTVWFAPGKGLVKLVVRHGDHSVSTVERTK